MPVLLEGGTLVTELREGAFVEAGSLRVWSLVGRATGTSAISLRTIEAGPGLSPGLRNAECDEVLYVMAGQGTLVLDGAAHPISPETGIFVRAGVTFAISNATDAPMVLVSSRCPDPQDDLETFDALPAPSRDRRPQHLPIARLADQPRESAGDRWYAAIVDAKMGSEEITQFVGGIPPERARAPLHAHLYEEVLCVLSGEGRMWSGDTSAPIREGSCIFLPRAQLHGVENTGPVELRVLGVYFPAGSTTARHDL
jgi:mannose-6-phosphate isomerase-like protein (cupin superfamily)